jgi:ankyrin repeat protein
MIDKNYNTNKNFINIPINKMGDTILHYAAYK